MTNMYPLFLSAVFFGLVGCYAKDAPMSGQPHPADTSGARTTSAPRNEPAIATEPPAHTDSEGRLPAGGDRPGSANLARARELDSRFSQEQRDSAWALDIEQKAHRLMVDGGAKTVSQFVCRASVCVGTYAFPSIDVFKQAWNPLCGELDFQGECIFAPSDGALEFMFYIIRNAAMGRVEPR